MTYFQACSAGCAHGLSFEIRGHDDESLSGIVFVLRVSYDQPLYLGSIRRSIFDRSGKVDVRARIISLPKHSGCTGSGFGCARFMSIAPAFLIDPNRVVMIGDRPDTDILGASRAGLRTVLVRTGRFLPGWSYPENLPEPNLDIDSLAELDHAGLAALCT